MCHDATARPPLPPGAAGMVRGDDMVLTAADGTRFAACLASPDRPATAAVLILPDIRGLHQFYKDLAVRFAEQGVTAVAMDYFGRTAGIGARDDSFEYMPHFQQITFATLLADVRASLDHLRSGEAAPPALFTVGFCMGGSLSLLTGTQDLHLAGVIAFYAGLARNLRGGGSVLERAMSIQYPALGLFGGADQGIPPEQVETLDQELDTAGVEHEIVTYPGAPHSFFDRRATDYAQASADAWTRVLTFISAHTS